MTLRGEDVCLHAQLAAADDLSLVGSGGGGVALQRDQAGVDRVHDPLGIREEVLVPDVVLGDNVLVEVLFYNIYSCNTDIHNCDNNRRHMMDKYHKLKYRNY